MKCFSWQRGRLTAGIETKADEKFGQVILLGEEGRGRHYEKVSLARQNPAEVIKDRVLEAYPRKIILSAQAGRPEKTFYVLERPTSSFQDVLVRLNTGWTYTKNTHGSWATQAGDPSTLATGHGAQGIAGRVGGWTDSLIILHPGDVISIHPEGGVGDKVIAWGLWMDVEGNLHNDSWENYRALRLIERARRTFEEKGSAGLEQMYATMPAFTWNRGELAMGTDTGRSATGIAGLHEVGDRAQKWSRYAFLGAAGRIKEAAVLKLWESATPARDIWGKPGTRKVYGLVPVAERQTNAALVRVDLGQTGSTDFHHDWKAHRGNPRLLGYGWNKHATPDPYGQLTRWANRLFWDEALFVIHEGDVLRVKAGEREPAYAITMSGGEVRTERWIVWEAKDGQHDPTSYMAKGMAPWSHIPGDWVGRVVSVSELRKERNRHWGEPDIDAMVEIGTGELVSIQPFVLNLGWNGEERRDLTVYSATWAKLEADKQVRRLTSEEVAHREALRKEAEDARLAEERRVAEELASTFGGHFRRMGQSGNADFWVVRPDGTIRNPDEISYRGRYNSEGDKRWKTFGADELGISWSKVNTAAPHEFRLDQQPPAMTVAQVETVSRIEREIAETWDNAVSMTGKKSPLVGKGWDLKSQSAPQPSPEESKPLAGESLNQALDALRAKFNGK